MFSDEHYKQYGFDNLQTLYLSRLWDKVGKHYGFIPHDFVEQMVTGAEFEMEDTWKKTKNTNIVFKGVCDYLEDLMTYNGITYK